MIITDTSYDALGRVASQSQPRYATASFSYTPSSSPLFRATTTTYDGLDRTLTVTAADNTQTRTSYGFDWQGLRQTTTYDAGQFTVLVFPENNPSASSTYQVAMSAGKSWRFHHWIYSNSALANDQFVLMQRTAHTLKRPACCLAHNYLRPIAVGSKYGPIFSNLLIVRPTWSSSKPSIPRQSMRYLVCEQSWMDMLHLHGMG